MKNFILLAILFCMFSCSEEKVVEDVPSNENNEKPNAESKDSVLYQLKIEDFELVAASKSGTAVFLQTDTLFAFRCLYDSCGTNRLVAYCDSLGVLERICVEGKVFDMLYHQDNSKLDIMYNNNGKIDYIRDVENPYKSVSSRAESGDVPYSAIKLQTNLSYAAYTIINTYPLELNKRLYSYVQKYSLPPFESELAIEIIIGLLGNEYKSALGNYYLQIGGVMSDYSAWVIKELYGGAIPIVIPYAERTEDNRVVLKCYVNDVDSLKSEFKIGMLIQESGNHWLWEGVINKNKTYNSGAIDYKFNFEGLKIGKKYEYRAYLAPLPSSKYLTGIKCLLNYYRKGQWKDFYLLETKAEVKGTTSTDATIELSCKQLDKRIRMGVLFYGTNPNLPEKECEKYEVESSGWFGGEGDEITKTIKIKDLKADTKYYYKPYIIYDGNIVNRELANVLDAIYEEDRTFYGEMLKFETKPLSKSIVGTWDNVECMCQLDMCSDLNPYHIDRLILREDSSFCFISNLSRLKPKGPSIIFHYIVIEGMYKVYLNEWNEQSPHDEFIKFQSLKFYCYEYDLEGGREKTLKEILETNISPDIAFHPIMFTLSSGFGVYVTSISQNEDYYLKLNNGHIDRTALCLRIEGQTQYGGWMWYGYKKTDDKSDRGYIPNYDFYKNIIPWSYCGDRH